MPLFCIFPSPSLLVNRSFLFHFRSPYSLHLVHLAITLYLFSFFPFPTFHSFSLYFFTFFLSSYASILFLFVITLLSLCSCVIFRLWSIMHAFFFKCSINKLDFLVYSLSPLLPQSLLLVSDLLSVSSVLSQLARLH